VLSASIHLARTHTQTHTHPHAEAKQHVQAEQVRQKLKEGRRALVQKKKNNGTLIDLIDQ